MKPSKWPDDLLWRQDQLKMCINHASNLHKCRHLWKFDFHFNIIWETRNKKLFIFSRTCHNIFRFDGFSTKSYVANSWMQIKSFSFKHVNMIFLRAMCIRKRLCCRLTNNLLIVFLAICNVYFQPFDHFRCE